MIFWERMGPSHRSCVRGPRPGALKGPLRGPIGTPKGPYGGPIYYKIIIFCLDIIYKIDNNIYDLIYTLNNNNYVPKLSIINSNDNNEYISSLTGSLNFTIPYNLDLFNNNYNKLYLKITCSIKKRNTNNYLTQGYFLRNKDISDTFYHNTIFIGSHFFENLGVVFLALTHHSTSAPVKVPAPAQWAF